MDTKEKMQVFYDGECCVCSAEISHYKKKDDNNSIDFVDICDEKFRAEDYGVAECDIHTNLHVKSSDGTMHRGIDAFIAIWENTPGFEKFARMMRYKIIYFFAKCGYAVFVRIRPFLPRKSWKITKFLQRIIQAKWNFILRCVGKSS